MKVTLLTLCDFAQENNGKLTIVGTFNILKSGTFPFTYPNPFYLVVGLRFKGSAKGLTRLSCIGPDGSEFIKSGEMNFSLGEKAVDNRERLAHFIFGFQNTVFRMPGTYEYRLFLDGRVVAETELYLDKS